MNECKWCGKETGGLHCDEDCRREHEFWSSWEDYAKSQGLSLRDAVTRGLIFSAFDDDGLKDMLRELIQVVEGEDDIEQARAVVFEWRESAIAPLPLGHPLDELVGDALEQYKEGRTISLYDLASELGVDLSGDKEVRASSE